MGEVFDFRLTSFFSANSIVLDFSIGFDCYLPYRTMRDKYIKEAQEVVADANVLINEVSRRVKQLRRGSRPLVESLEKLSPEDIALREIIERKVRYELPTSV